MENNWWLARSAKLQNLSDANNQHGFYNELKTIYGPTKCNITPVRSSEGIILKEKQEILDRWAQHFGGLLNQRNPTEPTILDMLPTLPPIMALNDQPTFPETRDAIKALKNNKSPGPDGLPSELFKEGGYLLHHSLHNLMLSI